MWQVSRKCFLELIQGADRAPADHQREERAKVSRFVASLQILPFASDSARIAARINADPLNRGTPVSITDVFVAATGLRHKLTVVTNTTKGFRHTSWLKLENGR